MANRVVILDKLIEQTRMESGRGWAEARARVWEALNEAYPVDLNIIEAVTYHEKSDRYTVKFSGNTVKVTPETATFILTHGKVGSNYGAKPHARAQVTDGVIVSVALIFLSEAQ